MSNKPAYLQSINIRCIGGCSQIIKSDGDSVMTHMVLRHKYSPSETALICRKCRNDYKIIAPLISTNGNWTQGELVEVYRPAAEYEEPLRRALRIFDKAMQPEYFTYAASPESFTEQKEIV